MHGRERVLTVSGREKVFTVGGHETLGGTWVDRRWLRSWMFTVGRFESVGYGTMCIDI